MNITIKATGPMGKYLPAGANGSLAPLDVAEGATPIDVMGQLGVPLDGSYLISVNGSAIPKAKRSEHRLEDGDTLAIMPPLRGG